MTSYTRQPAHDAEAEVSVSGMPNAPQPASRTNAQ
eukprot:CAMPEP_0179854126 /NCGR_PEP_ID=MMETSP0982-20121206/9744_1 /TAXON_ID=483367 /ORGANISM="non described non described, Strain CCMP 2436" /LENGTH=34 /DNA_ID= /DNA_START= /DNA_END= /DNA_ORIENTATION=